MLCGERQVPIVGANMELHPSFDHEVNQHRYSATDFIYGWSIRPIMSQQDNVFEHDDGVEMFQVARDGVLRLPGKCVDGFPASMVVQVGACDPDGAHLWTALCIRLEKGRALEMCKWTRECPIIRRGTW